MQDTLSGISKPFVWNYTRLPISLCLRIYWNKYFYLGRLFSLYLPLFRSKCFCNSNMDVFWNEGEAVVKFLAC
jgi:hypothetical protein